MPRLPFWGLSAAAAASMSYAGYHFVYESYYVAQRTEEQRLTDSKQHYQDVIHAYARLRARLEQQQQQLGRNGAASSAWFTNADKIVFFCDVQLLRRLLWTLPHHAVTEQDLCRMFLELAGWERRNCTELHFRDTPLLFTQTMRSLACYALYVLIFRVAAPLLGMWDGFAGGQVRLLHHAARFITGALEINVVMTTSAAKSSSAEMSNDSSAKSVDEENRKQAAAVQSEASAQCITLSTEHWIEEVGFWASASNPLLAQHLRTHKSLKQSQETRSSAPVRLMRGSPAAVTTYAEHWRAVAAQDLAREKEPAVSSSPTLVDVAAEEVSLGYPALPSAARLMSTESSSISKAAQYIPVGISGLPHVLYVDAAHAVSDVRPRRTREEVYAQREQAQFVRTAAVAADGSKVADDEHAKAGGAASPLTALRRWRTDGGPPCWQHMWWGGVYGGAHPSYTLHYHLGAPCTAANYVTEAIEASRAAEELSSSGT